MQTNFLYAIIFTLTIATFQIYTMELVDISEKPHSEQLPLPFHLSDDTFNKQSIISKKLSYNPTLPKQLKLPEEVIDQIIAYCSYRTQCRLQNTCKEFYHLASIDRLSKFTKYNFQIGDEKERTTFFKKLIKTNNPDLIATIVNHAKKEAMSYHFTRENNATHIIIDQDYCTQEYIQNFYLNPLSQEAIKQSSKTMITQLEKEDPKNMKVYVQAKETIKRKKFKTTFYAIVGIVLFLDVCGGIILGVTIPLASNHSIYQ